MEQVATDQNIYQNGNKLLDLLNEFEDVLNKEFAALKSADASLIINVTTSKKIIAENIEQVFKELAENNFTDKHSSVKRFSVKGFIQQKDFTNFPIELQQLFKNISLKTKLCHDQNIANGASIQSLKNLNDMFLQIIKGEDSKSKTYTSSGSSTKGTITSKPIGKA